MSEEREHSEQELPDDVVDEAERLTRLARNAVDDDEAAAYDRHREELLSEYGFTARIRGEDDVLVLHPAEWVEDGAIRVERIDDTGRAVEVPLSAPGDEDDWEAVEAHNATLVERVADEHGEIHAANCRAFADFLGNHYVRRVEDTTAAEIDVFLSEYYPRNAWPSERQRDVVEQSLELLFEVVDVNVPGRSRVR
ncbi:hypothetical protein SAMN04487950_2029 [Halogranum rubrum]|uniref:RnhA operon protein n=1 Tax=Halogranum rubrum TaxID=553466 RepID=A0A1I4EDJ4_9EURY|nr:rnhA operon protein [Halogranum rubrum]SFL02657.1 hypothetical protein SAMN04487950_2029 [Halogranum rubrum]